MLTLLASSGMAVNYTIVSFVISNYCLHKDALINTNLYIEYRQQNGVSKASRVAFKVESRKEHKRNFW